MTLYTDIDEYCCEVIRARIADGSLPAGEVWCRDVTKLTDQEISRFDQVHLFCGIGGSPLGLKMAGWSSDVPIITGGFPCQDVSDAGLRAGITAPRSGLFREVVRAFRLAPRAYGILENVAALLWRGMGTVLGDLAGIGRDAEWDCLSARDVGMCHRRRRIWIMVHPVRSGRERTERCWISSPKDEEERRWADYQPSRPMPLRAWLPRPNAVGSIPIATDGVPGKMDRRGVRSLGNAQVPKCVEVIARNLISTALS